MFLSTIFAGGGSIFGTSIFAKYWLSIVLTGTLTLLATVLMAYKAEKRRGYQPLILAIAALPAMLLQPALMARSAEETTSLLSDPLVDDIVTATTWVGVAAFMTASLWNASVDRKLMNCRRRYCTGEQLEPCDMGS